MFSVIKLLLFFIVFIVICESVGIAILNKSHIDSKIIALPIGMVACGCLYEILIFPIQYLKLDSSLLKYALILSFIISIYFGRKELKSIYKYLSIKDIVISVVFIIIFLVMCLDLRIYGVDYQCSDNLFYIPLINGLSIDGIRVNGFDSNLCINKLTDVKYVFYGQLHYLSALSNLLNVDSLITINFYHKWYLIAFYLTNLYNIYYLCLKSKLFNKINKILLLVFLSTSFLSSLIIHETSLVSTTNILFVIMPLVCYLKDNNKGWLVLFVLYSIHAISIRSTYIFLLAFALLPYYLYLLLNNRFEIKENVYIILPVLISLVLYVTYGRSIYYLLVLLLLLVSLVIFLPRLVKLIGDKKTQYLYCFVLFVMFLYFVVKSHYIGNISSTWDNIPINELLKSYFFDFSSYSNIINSIYYLSFLFFSICIFIFNIIKKKNISYYVLHSIFIFIFCINRFVAPFLASFLTQVYERLFWVWVNPLFYLLVIDEFIGIFEESITKKILVVSLSIVLIMNISILNSFQYIKYLCGNFNYFRRNHNDVSVYYKAGSNSLEIGKIIDKYASDNQKQYVQIACPTNLLNLNFVSNRIRLSSLMGDYGTLQRFLSYDYYSQKWNESEYKYPIYFYLLEPYRFFDDWHIENAAKDIPDLGGMLNSSKTELFVINKWENREETNYHFNEYLSSFSDLLYENDLYQIYVVK